MTVHDIEPSQRMAARIAGLMLVLPFVILVFVEFTILEPLVVTGDAAKTAQNILAHTPLFRLGISCDVLYSVGNVILLTALYIVLRPAGRGLVLLATFFRLAYAAIWLLIALDYFNALKFLGSIGSMTAFSTEQWQALAKLSISSGFDTYYIGLLFFGLASTVYGVLWFRSRYIPRGLAIFGVVASVWAVFCSFAFYLSPDFAKVVGLWGFDTPLALFEIVTGLWLSILGIRPSGMAEMKA
jgi:hypothetical protein